MRMDDERADAEEVRARTARRLDVNLAVADVHRAFGGDARAVQA